MLDSVTIIAVVLALAFLLAIELRAKIGRVFHRRPLARFVRNEWLPSADVCERMERD